MNSDHPNNLLSYLIVMTFLLVASVVLIAGHTSTATIILALGLVKMAEIVVRRLVS